MSVQCCACQISKWSGHLSALLESVDVFSVLLCLGQCLYNLVLEVVSEKRAGSMPDSRGDDPFPRVRPDKLEAEAEDKTKQNCILFWEGMCGNFRSPPSLKTLR